MTKILVTLIVVLAVATTAPRALAQAGFPHKPVRLVAPFPAGGPTDLLARLAAEQLAALWKQPVIVENRAGASGSIGSALVAKATPDGYTLLLGNSASNGAYELLNPGVTPYRTLRDFAAVSLIATAPLIMVARAGLNFKDLKDYVRYAKAHPGKLNYASAAIGSAPHLGAELLNLVAGIRVTHVPFNGAAPALHALLSNTVDSYMGGVSSVMPHVRSGSAVALALIGAERSAQVPDLPTAGEQGFKGVEYVPWYGLLAPAAVPVALLDRINDDFQRAFSRDDVKERLARLGFEHKLGSRADFARLLVAEQARNQRIIREASITAN